MTDSLTVRGAVLGRGGKTLLDGVTVSCAPGELLGVVGPNGAGKTTLIRAGLGLARLSEGSAQLFGKPIASLSEPERAALVGYLPQERRPAWNLPAWRVAALGAAQLPPQQARQRALQALAEVGVEHLAEQGVLDMSGGERARVLMARLLVTGAPLLIADEPAAGLDPEAQILILQRLRAAAASGAAVIVTLHDLGLAARFCDRLLVMHRGQVAADGEPRVALRVDVLKAVFGLEGQLIDTPAGLVLAAGRLQEPQHG